MDGVLRKSIFAVPFGCLVAVATHLVRFGDEHAFGGGADAALVSTAIGGSVAIALVILHAFLHAGSTLMTGSLASKRLRALIPSAPAVFALAASIYYGIEALEGNGLEIGLPTVVLAAFSIGVAFALRRGAAFIAHVVADIIHDWLALLDRRERLIWHLALRSQPQHLQFALVARRFGRAPPDGRRFR